MFAEFKTLPQLFDFFKEESTCLQYWENIRWSKTGVLCPKCGAGGAYKTNRGYKCKDKGCQKKFSALVGTIFENSKLPLRTWFGAIYLCGNHKKGVSSLQLSRDLGIHQSSAWFLLHRIREVFKEDFTIQLGGDSIVVEADTTIHGGKVKNMNNKKRKLIAEKKGMRNDNKTSIAGYVERGGTIRLSVIKKGENEPNLLREHVDCGSALMTDTANTFVKVGKEYVYHGSVDHTKSEYCRDKVIHTNTIEGAFSHFDRMVIGVYHSISSKHLQAYANESAYRYNTRKVSDVVRFEGVVGRCDGVRLKYLDLIGDKKVA